MFSYQPNKTALYWSEKQADGSYVDTVALADVVAFHVCPRYPHTEKRMPTMRYGAGAGGFRTALGINMHSGNVWAVNKDGKRKRIKEVWN